MGGGDIAREAMRQPQEEGCPGDQDAEPSLADLHGTEAVVIVTCLT